MSFSCTLPKLTTFAAIALISIAATGAARAQSATEIQLSYKDKTLKVEKVVAGSSDATINVRAQKPGRYEFFDEYNEKVARGALVVK